MPLRYGAVEEACTSVPNHATHPCTDPTHPLLTTTLPAPADPAAPPSHPHTLYYAVGGSFRTVTLRPRSVHDSTTVGEPTDATDATDATVHPGYRLSYSTRRKALTPQELRQLVGRPYPRRICPHCRSSGERVAHRFRRCDNCEGTGGVKGVLECLYCKGSGVIVQEKFDMVPCQECECGGECGDGHP